MQLEYDFTIDGTADPAQHLARKCAWLEDLQAGFHTFLAHELPNQLVPLQAFAKLLFDTTAEGFDDDSRFLLERIADLTQHIDRLARKVAHLGRLLKQPTHGSAVDLEGIIQEVMVEVQTQHPAQSMTICYDLSEKPFLITLSEQLFHQLLLQLLQNAVVAIQNVNPGCIWVQIAKIEDCLQLIVRDNGRGIVHPRPERLCKPFDAGRQQGGEGLGLGLFFVRQVVARWHGRLKLESDQTKGTEVQILVPLSPPRIP